MLIVPVCTTLVNFFLFLFQAPRKSPPGRNSASRPGCPTAFRESPLTDARVFRENLSAQRHAAEMRAMRKNDNLESPECEWRECCVACIYEFLKLIRSLRVALAFGWSSARHGAEFLGAELIYGPIPRPA